MSPQQSRKRPLVAALLSVLQPGLGHLYLREWLRMLVWFGLWVGAVAVVLATAPVQYNPIDLLTTVVGGVGWTDDLSTEILLALLSVSVFSTIDAYWVAARNNYRLAGGARCPSCGKELDETLDFCHWCTTEVPSDVDEA